MGKDPLFIWYTIDEKRKHNWGRLKKSEQRKENVSNIKEQFISCFFLKESSSGHCEAT